MNSAQDLSEHRARGFTLIELVIVITIVGILAAVALPRFIGVQSDARSAKAQSIYGAIKSAAALAKARCELDLAQTAGGNCTATAGTINMDGATVDMINKYPAASATGIDLATQLTSAEGLTISGSAPRTYDMVGATTAANCRISYTAAVLGAAPVVNVVTTGC